MWSHRIFTVKNLCSHSGCALVSAPWFVNVCGEGEELELELDCRMLSLPHTGKCENDGACLWQREIVMRRMTCEDEEEKEPNKKMA